MCIDIKVLQARKFNAAIAKELGLPYEVMRNTVDA